MRTDPRDDLGSSAELRLIDAVCDAFERALAAGQNPSIESYIEKHPEIDPKILRHELIIAECHHLKTRGEHPDLAAYSERFFLETDELEKIKSDWRRKSAAPTKAIEDSTEKIHDGEFELTADDAATGEATIAVLERRGFRDIRRIGHGAYGEVYRAYDPRRECEVAIKTPTDKTLGSPKARQRFLNEAEIGKQFDHPNVVKTLGIETFEGLDLIIQQFIDGQNLEQWFDAFRKRDELPEPETVVELLLPVARALAHVHQRGYSHQDLKPENILIDQVGNVFVTDFGLTIHESDQRSWRGSRAGTMPYMSPEQIRWQTHLIDGRSDIWSFGVILYRLLSGVFPFGGPPPKSKSEQERYCDDLEKEITELDARPIRQQRPGLSRYLAEIYKKCLAKSTKDRYENGDDLAEDLLLYVEKRSASVPSATPNRPIKIVPKGLRSFDAGDSDFFLELLPGPRYSDGVPESIRFLENRLQGADGNEPLDLGIIFGPSGSGKSSLVKAGLIPRLQNNNYETLFIEATENDTEVRLLKGLRGKLIGPGDTESMSVVDVYRLVAQRYKANGRKLLVVIDQFEQWLADKTHFAAEQLVKTFRECNGVGIQVLILTRDDFWWRLNEFTSAIELSLSEGSNYLRVKLFDRDHAERILMAFGEAYGKLPAADRLDVDQREFLEKSLDDLADQDEYVPVRLALFAEMMSDRPWTMEELKRIGGAKGVGIAFLESRFGRNAPIEMKPYVEIAPRLLEAMLPPLGSDIKAQMLSVAQLGDATKADPKKLTSLLRLMEGDLKLLTKVEADRPEGAVSTTDKSEPTRLTMYQLTHDYLVGSIRQWLDERSRGSRGGRAKLMLRTQTELWNRLNRSTRYLPTSMEWLGMRLRTDKSEWTPMQAAMMRDSGRRVAMRCIGILASVAVMAMVGWVFYDAYQRGFDRQLQVKALFEPSTTPDEKVLDAVDKLVVNQNYLPVDTNEILREYANTDDTHVKTRQALLLVRLGSLEQGPIVFLQQQLTAPTTSATMWHAIHEALRHQGLVRFDALRERLLQDQRLPAAELLRTAASLASEDDFFAKLQQSEDLSKDIVAAVLKEPINAGSTWASGLSKVAKLLSPAVVESFGSNDLTSSQATNAATLLNAFDKPKFEAVVEVISAPTTTIGEFQATLQKVDEQTPDFKKSLLTSLGERLKWLDARTEKEDIDQTRIAKLLIAIWQIGKQEFIENSGSLIDLHALTRAVVIELVSEEWIPRAFVKEVIDRRGNPSSPLLPIALLALDEYIKNEFAVMLDQQRDQFKDRLFELATTHPSAEVHSASTLLLSRCTDNTKAQMGPRATALSGNDGRQWTEMADSGLTLVELRMPLSTGEKHSFAISTTEITNELFNRYRTVIKAGTAASDEPPSPGLPIGGIRTNEIPGFCDWLSLIDGIPESEYCYRDFGNVDSVYPMKSLDRLGYRLPTLDEWSFACGGGEWRRLFNYSDPTLANRYAWSRANSNMQASPVGTKLPNPYGLFDMLGNHEELVVNFEPTDPSNPPGRRILFATGGNCIQNSASFNSQSKTYEAPPRVIEPWHGFRLVRTIRVR